MTDQTGQTELPTNDQLRRLATWLPALQAPDFDFGHWAGGDKRPDGTITMPYYEFSDQAEKLRATLPIAVGFDWRTWMTTDRAQAFVKDHRQVASATPDELLKLTTAIVRSDRFTEGSIAGAFESGLLLEVVRRAATLIGS